jgi:multiple sugar transport system permease protein
MNPTATAARVPSSRRSRARRARRTAVPILRLLAAVLILAVLLFPIYWLIITSLSSPDQVLSKSLVPRNPSLDSYLFVLDQPAMWMFARNSLLIAGGVAIVGVGVSALGAYSLARLQFPGRSWLGRFVLFAYIAPPVLLVVPMFVVLARLGLVNTPIGLMTAQLAFAAPFCMWMLRGFFLSLPIELEDAALVDGCTRFGAFRRIVLPLAAPGLVAAGMYAFLLSWNDYLYALVFLQSKSQMTLPVGIQLSFFVENMSPSIWLHLLAASVLASLPVFLIFMLLQRWMVSGLTAGAVRG